MNNITNIENTIDIFVNQNGLEPADAILVKKDSVKFINHYIIYLGVFGNEHKFIANTLSGIKLFNYRELMDEMKYFKPIRIEKFTGTYYEREEAVSRAFSRLDENSYNLILNNCEHFKNWVQNEEHKSIQVENGAKLAIGTGIATTILSSNKAMKVAGIGALLLGGLAWALNKQNEKSKTETVFTNRR